MNLKSQVIFLKALLGLAVILVTTGCSGSINSVEDLLSSAKQQDADSTIPKITITSSTPPITEQRSIPFKISFEQPVELTEASFLASGGKVFNCSPDYGKSFQCTLVPESRDTSLQIIQGSLKFPDGSDAGQSNVLAFQVNSASKIYGLCVNADDFYQKNSGLNVK